MTAGQTDWMICTSASLEHFNGDWSPKKHAAPITGLRETFWENSVLGQRGEAPPQTGAHSSFSLSSDNEVVNFATSLYFFGRLVVIVRRGGRRAFYPGGGPRAHPLHGDPNAVSALNDPHRKVDVEQMASCHAAAEHPTEFHLASSREASMACSAASCWDC